jgi:hypothetical protein
MAAKTSSLLITAALALAACKKEIPVMAEVRSPSDITFIIPDEYRRDFCLNSAELRSVSGGESEAPIWRARLTPVNGAPCDYQIRFSNAARNFKVVRSVSALSAGEYEVVIDGGVSTARSRFEVGAASFE